MDSWKDILKGNPIPWLLEPDVSQPTIRYFTLRDILGYSDDDSEVRVAKSAIMSNGPVPKILEAQQPEGYWSKPGPGYSPKYLSTVWQIIFLAQMGADIFDSRVKAGCEYVLDHTITKQGWLSFNGTPSAFIHCLAGNLGAALIDLGQLGDSRLQAALDRQARFITGIDMADINTKHTAERYYAYTPGPMFACGPNAGLSCAWGAIKALRAFSKVPQLMRTQVMVQAINQGVDFLLSHDPAVADYPFGFRDPPLRVSKSAAFKDTA